MTAPSFIERDGAKIVSEMVALYESLTGRTLQPAQAERLLINAFAFRELLLREQIQATAVQMLVEFAVAPALDYLAGLVSVTRLAAAGATATIRFTLVAGHGGVIIPSGLRVASGDGIAVFYTLENVDVNVGTNVVDVDVVCETPGTVGNGYAIGAITTILDPQPYISTASNLAATSGGNDQETDEQLRERIRLAPSSFSVAGPVDAYKFHAKSASPAIIDVHVPDIPVVPGTVKIYPLVAGGIATPTPILDLVFAACNNSKIRPLTDTVEVESPTIINYDIEVEVEIYSEGDSVAIQATILAALTAYKDLRATQLGKDIQVGQISALSFFDLSKVFAVTVVSPATDIVVAASEVGICGTVTVTITGETDG